MIGIISDVHGNFEALKEVLKYFDDNNITDIYCLGDVVGYYTQVNECCDALRKRGVQCLMGNHDWYMVSDSFCPRSQSVNDCLAYQRSVIRADNKDWLSQALLYIKKDNCTMVHGGWTDPIDEYITPTEGYFSRLEKGFYFSGHTHIQRIFESDGRIYCNPGSVGQPRDGDNRAAFCLFDGINIYLKRVKYDIEKVASLMEENGFSGYYYDCLKVGAKTLGYNKGVVVK